MRRESRPFGAVTGQSGALPEIRLQGDSVVFYLEIANGREHARLVLRCDVDGQVWASVHGPAAADGAGGDAQ